MPNIIDLTNQVFGDLTVICRAKGKNHRAYWLCKCKCGNEKIINGTNLIHGKTKTCGHCKIKDIPSKGMYGIHSVFHTLEEWSNITGLSVNDVKECFEQHISFFDFMKRNQTIDETGNRYGKLTVIKQVENDKFNRACWLCKCDCGNEIVVEGAQLRSKEYASCGCEKKNRLKELTQTHGKSKTSTYQSWLSMKSRCYNRNNNRYENYGGRGIKVCEQWKNNFEQFLKDMGEKPNIHYSIDRIDVNGDYEPYNCRWATNTQQANNKQNSNHNYKKELEVIYWNIHKRCNVKTSKNYKNYGGRNIKLEWKSFIDFYRDMLKSYVEHREVYGRKNTSIDRIDVNGNYCKENCKWSTLKEQANNKRNTIVLVYKNISHTLFEWSKIVGIKQNVLYRRYQLHWNVEDILYKPVKNTVPKETLLEKHTYNSWKDMLRYAKRRNIDVQVSWNIYNNFFYDMGLKFEHSKLTRIDKTKGYSKENCIWKRSDKNG